IEDKLAGHRRPPNNLAGEQVHDHRDIKPSLPGPNVGDIRDPGRIRLGSCEIPLQDIRYRGGRRAPRGAPHSIATYSPNFGDPHQSRHAMLAAGLSSLTKVEKDPRRAINAVACCKRSADQAKKPCILSRSIRDRLLQPRIVTAGGDLKQSAHRPNAELMPMGLDESVKLANLSSTQSCRH